MKQSLVVFEVSPVTNVSSLYNFICMWKFLVVGCDAKPKIRPCDKYLFYFGRADDEIVATFRCLPCLGQVLRFTASRGLVLELEVRRTLLTERCVKLLVSVFFVHNFILVFERLINLNRMIMFPLSDTDLFSSKRFKRNCTNSLFSV